jgi:hypothetical protein
MLVHYRTFLIFFPFGSLQFDACTEFLTAPRKEGKKKEYKGRREKRKTEEKKIHFFHSQMCTHYRQSMAILDRKRAFLWWKDCIIAKCFFLTM